MATAAGRYNMEKSRCKKLLKVISEKLDEHILSGHKVDWDHVGEMAEIYSELAAIRDFLTHEEEGGPECTRRIV